MAGRGACGVQAAWIVVLGAMGGCDCNGTPADPCEGVDCSGVGVCTATPDGERAYCVCPDGYHPAAGDTECVENDPTDPCLGVECSGHGHCIVAAGLPVCVCDAGWVVDASGLVCLPESTGADADADGDADGGGGDADAEADVGDGDETWWVDQWVREPGPTRLDLVFLVDNSGSMAEEQAELTRRFAELVDELLFPGDIDGDTRPDHPPVDDLNVGVISPDMGVAGYALATCEDAFDGDDGCFQHAPSPVVTGCLGSYPTWLSRNPDNAASYPPSQLARDFSCIATLGTGGCGFEQPLKAMLKAVRENVAPGRCNEGFIRSDSRLALLFVTDEEDCSVDPAHPEMFDPSRGDLGELNIRCHLHPELVIPALDYARDFRALRPDGTASIFLGMIVGVPLDAPECVGRGNELAGCLDLPAMQERIDPAIPNRLIPSCDTLRGTAYPPRRFVELAEEWGKDGTSYVGSVCQADWTGVMAGIAEGMAENLRDDRACLPAELAFDAESCSTACFLFERKPDAEACLEDAACPSAWCPAATPETLDALAPCRDPSSGEVCEPLQRDLGTIGVPGFEERRCLIRQAPRERLPDECGMPAVSGWTYDPPIWSDHGCPEISFVRVGDEVVVDPEAALTLRCRR